MKRATVIIVALMALAALEFGLLGVDAAGIIGGGGHTLPPVGGGNVPGGNPTATNTFATGPTPIAYTAPASITLKADPLLITCDGRQSSEVSGTLFDASGSPVPDGTFVSFTTYNGNAQPQSEYTKNGGHFQTSVVFYSGLFPYGPNVVVDAGPLEAGIRVRCVPNSGCPLSPPASVSPPCGSPTPYPCVPSPGSGQMSPPCETPGPMPCTSSPPPRTSPPCPTPTPSPTPYPCIPSPGSEPLSPPCPTATPIGPPSCDPSDPGSSPPCPPRNVSPPLGTLSIALDCTPDAPTSVGACNVPSGATTFDVPVVVVNDTGAPVSIAAFNFEVHDSDTSRLLPLQGVDNNFNGNPDFNQSAFPSDFQCGLPPPTPDLGTDGPGRANSRLVCFSGDSVSTSIPPAGGKLVIAVLHYSVGSHTTGDVGLSFANVAFSNGQFEEIGSCNPQIDVEMGCFGTTVHFGSISPPTTAQCGDVDGNGRVTVDDLLLVVRHVGRNAAYDPRYDVNHDGRIDAADVGIVRKQLGTRC